MRLHATEAGDGPPLALLHGLFGQGQNLREVQRRLAERFRVVALDLRNHGASQHAPGMGYATQAADVAETLSALKALPCTLLGHSMGGKAAMRLALDRPEAVSGLVVVDIAPAPYPLHFRAYVDAMRALPMEPGFTRGHADAALAPVVPEPRVRAFLLQNFRTGSPPAWRFGLDEIAAGLEEIAAWEPGGRSYGGPATFIAGQRSDYIRPAHRAAALAQFPAARFVTVPDAGHWVHAENLPGFLDALDSALPRI